MRYGVPDFYEWIDPFDMVERLVDEMNRREEEHENEAAFAARAFSDATYMIRRQAEEMMRPALELAALTPPAPMFVRPK